MLEENAVELVKKYIAGWRQNNLSLITACLAEDCIIIESHGPTYHGIFAIKQWFKLWLEAKSVVLKWDVTSFSFCEKEQTAFCEWDFSCVSNNIKYILSGISVVKFVNQKIVFIHEYRMTNPTYMWDGNKLKSE